jgi:hypothetical protein
MKFAVYDHNLSGYINGRSTIKSMNRKGGSSSWKWHKYLPGASNEFIMPNVDYSLLIAGKDITNSMLSADSYTIKPPILDPGIPDYTVSDTHLSDSNITLLTNLGNTSDAHSSRDNITMGTLDALWFARNYPRESTWKRPTLENAFPYQGIGDSITALQTYITHMEASSSGYIVFELARGTARIAPWYPTIAEYDGTSTSRYIYQELNKQSHKYTGHIALTTYNDYDFTTDGSLLEGDFINAELLSARLQPVMPVGPGVNVVVLPDELSGDISDRYEILRVASSFLAYATTITNVINSVETSAQTEYFTAKVSYTVLIDIVKSMKLAHEEYRDRVVIPANDFKSSDLAKLIDSTIGIDNLLAERNVGLNLMYIEFYISVVDGYNTLDGKDTKTDPLVVQSLTYDFPDWKDYCFATLTPHPGVDANGDTIYAVTGYLPNWDKMKRLSPYKFSLLIETMTTISTDTLDVQVGFFEGFTILTLTLIAVVLVIGTAGTAGTLAEVGWQGYLAIVSSLVKAYADFSKDREASILAENLAVVTMVLGGYTALTNPKVSWVSQTIKYSLKLSEMALSEISKSENAKFADKANVLSSEIDEAKELQTRLDLLQKVQRQIYGEPGLRSRLDFDTQYLTPYDKYFKV